MKSPHKSPIVTSDNY